MGATSVSGFNGEVFATARSALEKRRDMGPGRGRAGLKNEVRRHHVDDARRGIHGAHPLRAPRRNDPIEFRCEEKQWPREPFELGGYVHGQRGRDPMGNDARGNARDGITHRVAESLVAPGQKKAHERAGRSAVPEEGRQAGKQSGQRSFDEASAKDDGRDPRAAVGDEQRQRTGERLCDEAKGSAGSRGRIQLDNST